MRLVLLCSHAGGLATARTAKASQRPNPGRCTLRLGKSTGMVGAHAALARIAWPQRRPSRATASAPRHRPPRPSSRTRCASAGAHRGGRRCRGPPFSLSSIASSCLTKARCASMRQRGHGGIDDLEAHRGVGARCRIDGQVLQPGRPLGPIEQHPGVGIGAGHQRRQAADAFRPIQAHPDSPRRTASRAC